MNTQHMRPSDHLCSLATASLSTKNNDRVLGDGFHYFLLLANDGQLTPDFLDRSRPLNVHYSGDPTQTSRRGERGFAGQAPSILWHTEQMLHNSIVLRFA